MSGLHVAGALRIRTRIDEARGSFEYDCSGFVGYALGRAAPDAHADLHWTPGKAREHTSTIALAHLD